MTPLGNASVVVQSSALRDGEDDDAVQVMLYVPKSAGLITLLLRRSQKPIALESREVTMFNAFSNQLFSINE